VTGSGQPQAVCRYFQPNQIELRSNNCAELSLKTWSFSGAAPLNHHTHQRTKLAGCSSRFRDRGYWRIWIVRRKLPLKNGSCSFQSPIRFALGISARPLCLTNLSYTRVSGNEGHLRATLMMFVLSEGDNPTPNALADVEDHYRREEGTWHIAARTTTPI
jgi:hypothetical protein